MIYSGTGSSSTGSGYWKSVKDSALIILNMFENFKKMPNTQSKRRINQLLLLHTYFLYNANQKVKF